MALELISARKKIKQYIKHMPDGSDKEYLEKIQKGLKSFVNNTRPQEVKVNKVYGNTKVAIWSIEQNFISDNVTLILEYDSEKELYQFEWAYGLTHAYSFRHYKQLEYPELKPFIVKVFNEEFVNYAKY